MEKSFSRFTHTANIIFEKAVGGDSAENETEAGFAWSSRYRWKKFLQPGFEFHEEQTHQAGPALYGRLGPFVKYDVGYLFGLTDPAPEGTLKWILEFERYF